MMNVRLGTARTIMVGPVLDADGVAKTNLAVAAILASKNGGNPAALDGSATLTHKQTGHYLLLLTANDISALGVLELSIDSTTDAMPIKALNVLTAAAWDALHAASGGYVPSYTNGFIGTALTETTPGFISAGVKKFFDKATPTGTINSLADAIPGAAGGGFIAGTNAETTVTTAINANLIGNITGNLSGSVGSLTGHTNQSGNNFPVLGTAVALDGGAATISGMLTKMADDNGGANFDAGLNSLEKITTTVAAGFPQNINADAEPAGGVITTGTNTANDSDATWANDGVYWQVAATAAVGGFGLNMYQVFTLGTTLKASILGLNAKETLAGRVHVWLWDYDAADWEQVSDNDTAISGATDNDYTYIMHPRNQQTSDGEVQVRYSSTDTATNKYLYLDQVHIQAVAVSDLTAAEIAQAVWEADLNVVHGAALESAGHIVHDTFALQTTVATQDSTTSFTITDGVASATAYVGMVIIVEDETDDHYEARRIVTYTSGRVVTVDKPFSFTPAVGDHAEIVNLSYADVNVTHLASSAVQQSGGYIKVSNGTGTGQIDLDAGEVKIKGLADASAAKLDDILDGTGGTGLKINSFENTGTTTLTGAVSLGSTLGVTGAVTLSSTVATGAVTFASVAVTGALTTGSIVNNGVLTQTGNATLAGTYTVDGISTHTGAVTYTGGIVANITGTVSGNSTHNASDVWDAYTGITLAADVQEIDGDGASAASLQDFVNAGYSSVTHKVQGVVLTDTLTTYTGNTKQTGNNYPIVSHVTYGNAAIRTRGDIAWITATTTAVGDKTGFSLASTGLDLVTVWTTAITGNITGNLSGSVGSVSGAVGSIAAGGIVAATFATDAIAADAFAAATANEIADATLSRNVSNVEATAAEYSLCTIVLATLESSIAGAVWTIKRTNGSTTHATKAVTTDSAADPITGVS